MEESRRSDAATTRTRKCSRGKIFLNVPEIASCRYMPVFLPQTLRLSVPQSTSIYAARTPDGVAISKYPSGISGMVLVSGSKNESHRRNLESGREANLAAM